MVLESLARSQSGAHREVVRAKALLMAADGVANTAIARSLSVSPASVKSWRDRFAEEGLAKLGQVRKGRGRKPSIPQSKIDEIIDLTQNYRPTGETHWSCRTMAAAAGVSKSTVQLVWHARGLKLRRVQTFKLSNDPRFEEKLVDVVGLYINPPEKAIVLCADEKSSVQALDRTQASLPMVKGRGETMTHDYKRHGTTTLFAALDVLTGTVIGQCMPRHRHQEWLKFLKTVDREVPNDLAIHLILDNYATHKHQDVGKWLDNHPRFHLHFTPTSEPSPVSCALPLLGTAQDASRPEWSGKSCADVAFERCPGEHDWRACRGRPRFSFGAASLFGNVVVEVGRSLVLFGNRGLLLRARVGKSCYLLASPRYARRQWI